MSRGPTHEELIEAGFTDLGEGVYAQRVPRGVNVMWLRDPDEEASSGFDRMQARVDAWLIEQGDAPQ